MKKLLAVFAVCVVLLTTSHAQVLLTETFDGVTFPPTGWVQTNYGWGAPWDRSTSSPYAGAGSAYVYGSTDFEDCWLFSPLLSLNASETYKISYYQKTANVLWDSASMKVTVGTAQTNVSQTTTLANYPSLSNSSYVLREHTFLCTASGNYSFAFYCYSSDMQSPHLYVDEVVIERMPGCTPLAGTYTIGGASPDYASFTAAVADLISCGISAAVTFNVRPGTYTEQVSLPAITGSSAANTITFQAENGDPASAVLQFTPTLALNYVFQLNGADNIILQNLTFQITGITDYARLLSFYGGNDNILIDNNTLMGRNVSNIYTAVDARSLMYSPTTSADSLSNCVISNNRMRNGSNGIHLYYGNSSLYQEGNVIQGNTISDFTGHGMNIYYAHNIKITENIINNSSGFQHNADFRINNCSGGDTKIAYNKAISNNSYPATQCFSLTSIIGDVGNPADVYNNFASNIHTGTGWCIGIYLTSCQNIDVAFNNIYVENNVSATTNVRGIYVLGVTTANLRILNNIIYNGGTRGSCISDGVTAGRIVQCDYNDLYAPLTGIIGYVAAVSYATLANWQANGRSYDASSVSINPLYVSTSDLHINEGTLFGAAIAIAGISDDIDYQARANPPTIGADELPNPLPVSWISFEVNGDIRGVELHWSTASETNSDHFSIEKSDDGIHFSAFETVKAAGNSNSLIHYLAYDPKPFCGSNYYRIKETDIDGTESTTGIRHLDVIKCNNVNIYPSPAVDQLFLSFAETPKSEIKIRVYDASGSMIISEILNPGLVNYIIDVSALTWGLYYIFIQSDNIIIQHPFLKE